jgi:hypothetical protein
MLGAVHLSYDVYRAMLSHALTTESYEVMGLLIGDVLVRRWNWNKRWI